MSPLEQTTTHIGRSRMRHHVSDPVAIPQRPKRESSGPHSGECGYLANGLADAMAAAWAEGERVGVEHFLERHPELEATPEAVLDLLYEEICLRREQGEVVELEAVVRRFPQWRQQIEVLERCVSALNATAAFPLVGDTIGDFDLVAELGRGAQGRVFLATQASLGARPVVLKITPRSGEEHLSLARLQHTHIVPLLTAAEVPERHLRVLCMPYFGGLTLAALLAALESVPQEQRSGQSLLDLLDAARSAAPLALPPGRDPASPFLSRASFVQATCWLGACLAEALKYAHERGLVHLDLKPSNVLLTADRQPMLLDFHLAREPLVPSAPGTPVGGTRFGGTPAYMSPEQRRAMAVLRDGNAPTETIDGRSDIYSLGLVLHEALGGPFPDAQGRFVPLQRSNPLVPPGLSDIVGKCLAPDPRDRYLDAGMLAGDLWAHLNDQPLRGVANRSLPERWRKWRRRRPHLLSLLSMLGIAVLALGAALTVALAHIHHRVDEARQALRDGETDMAGARFDEAAVALKRGLAQLDSVPFQQDLREDFGRRLTAARRAATAAELHRIAERIRFLSGGAGYNAAAARALAAHCRTFWDKRDMILDRLGDESAPAFDDVVRADLLDLAILGSKLQVRLAAADQVAATRRAALEILEHAEKSFGPSAVLYHERRLHAAALGDARMVHEAARQALQCPPRTAWECQALGRTLLDEGNIEKAAEYFEQALRLAPRGLWSHFHHGVCCYRLGRFDDAVIAFTVCTTLAPDSAGCYVNRALAFAASKNTTRALQDFDRAHELDAAVLADHPEASRLLETLRAPQASQASRERERPEYVGAPRNLWRCHVLRSLTLPARR